MTVPVTFLKRHPPVRKPALYGEPCCAAADAAVKSAKPARLELPAKTPASNRGWLAGLKSCNPLH